MYALPIDYTYDFHPRFLPDIEVANRHGHTCLMIACYKGHLRIAKYLISIGADVNRKSVKGNTALHDCAESGSLEIMKLLLVSGALMDVDAYGTNPGGGWGLRKTGAKLFSNLIFDQRLWRFFHVNPDTHKCLKML
jgi:ankyrin repeat protein